MESITSRQNAHFKQARKLAESARERHKSGKILLEGTRLVDAYIERFGSTNTVMLVTTAGTLHAQVRAILDTAMPKSAYCLTDELFAEISTVESPEGLVCIAGVPKIEARATDDFRLLLDGVQDPGNLGGLLRTAAAAGATSAHLAKGCADPWSPKALRGGMGAQFSLSLRERIEFADSLAGFRGTVVATSPTATHSIYDVDLSGPVAMIFGNEGRGLSDEIVAMANQLVTIPMAEGVESLNVAASAAVCCFERRRQAALKNRGAA